LTFHIFNRGKRSLALDLNSEAGRLAFDELVATADILVHNLRPGVTDRLGIDATTLCARYPRLIYCEISAFGHLGPLADSPGYEPLIQAYSGLSATNGGPQDPPTRVGASICDQGSGMWAVIGALSLLQRRHVTGRGGIVQASLLETAMAWNAQKSDAYVNEGRLPERHASGHPGLVPYEAFDTADEPILICCGNDRLFAKLADVMQRTDWVQDPRFTTNRARLQNKDALLTELRTLLKGRPRDAWVQAFSSVGVPCAPLHSLPQALQQPQVEALGMLCPVPDEDFRLTGMPLSVDGVRPAIHRGAPRLGADNERYGLPAAG
nr:CoA transferase [Pseudomonas sp.]